MAVHSPPVQHFLIQTVYPEAGKIISCYLIAQLCSFLIKVLRTDSGGYCSCDGWQQGAAPNKFQFFNHGKLNSKNRLVLFRFFFFFFFFYRFPTDFVWQSKMFAARTFVLACFLQGYSLFHCCFCLPTLHLALQRSPHNAGYLKPLRDGLVVLSETWNLFVEHQNVRMSADKQKIHFFFQIGFYSKYHHPYMWRIAKYRTCWQNYRKLIANTSNLIDTNVEKKILSFCAKEPKWKQRSLASCFSSLVIYFMLKSRNSNDSQSIFIRYRQLWPTGKLTETMWSVLCEENKTSAADVAKYNVASLMRCKWKCTFAENRAMNGFQSLLALQFHKNRCALPFGNLNFVNVRARRDWKFSSHEVIFSSSFVEIITVSFFSTSRLIWFDQPWFLLQTTETA